MSYFSLRCRCLDFTRLLIALVALTVAAVVIAIPQSDARAEPVVFYPGWFPSMQFAGVYVALERGFYTDAGLEVEVRPFAYGLDTPAKLAASDEVCALGTIEGYILMQKRADGHDLRTLAAMIHESPAGFMILAESPIRAVADFPGRRIGVHKFADPLYRFFMKRAGLDPTAADMRFVGDDPRTLIDGEVDAMQGYATEEFVRLQALTGGTSRFLSFSSLGFPSYSEILYTTGAQIERHRPALARFVQATQRGWVYAFEHPEEAVAVVAARIGPDAEPAHLRASLAAVRDYVSPHGKPPLSPMDPERWRIIQEACIEMGFLKKAEPVENFLPPFRM
jgi:ABC-type nitrate/sulfonate/bicarbonate transport system substrate-binding protein